MYGKLKVPAWLGNRGAGGGSNAGGANRPAWMNSQSNVQPQVVRPPMFAGNSIGNGSGQWDYSKPMYQTGPNERRVVNVNGEQIRMAPNTVIMRPPKPQSAGQAILDALMGRAPRNPRPSGSSAVRG